MTILFAFLLAHLAGDFLWQFDPATSRNRIKKALLRHWVHHLIANGLAVAFLSFDTSVGILWLLLCSAILVIMHGMIDLIHVYLANKSWKDEGLPPFLQNWPLFLFVLNQTLHLLSLLLFTWLLLDANLSIQKLSSNLERGLMLAVILTFGTKVAGIFIQLLADIPPKHHGLAESKMTLEFQSKEDRWSTENKVKIDQHSVLIGEPRVSRSVTIGYLERLIVMALTFTGNYSAIAFIISAKTLARFKLLDDREWAEYFLVGTLASVFIGMSCGYMLRLFW